MEGVEFDRKTTAANAEKGIPTGVLTAGKEGVEGTFTRGFWQDYEQGSWYLTYNNWDIVAPSGPLTEGTVTISKDGDNYTISLNCTDDLENRITGEWTGKAEIYDYDICKTV